MGPRRKPPRAAARRFPRLRAALITRRRRPRVKLAGASAARWVDAVGRVSTVTGYYGLSAAYRLRVAVAVEDDAGEVKAEPAQQQHRVVPVVLGL